jgi:hypothetical protein
LIVFNPALAGSYKLVEHYSDEWTRMDRRDLGWGPIPSGWTRMDHRDSRWGPIPSGWTRMDRRDSRWGPIPSGWTRMDRRDSRWGPIPSGWTRMDRRDSGWGRRGEPTDISLQAWRHQSTFMATSDSEVLN